MQISIEKDVPMPDKRIAYRSPMYPYADMEVGDSFLVPLKDDEDRTKQLRRVRQSTMWAKQRYAPRRFSARVTDEGVRVWRVA